MFHNPEPSSFQTHIPYNLYPMFLLSSKSKYKTAPGEVGTKFEEEGSIQKTITKRNKNKQKGKGNQ